VPTQTDVPNTITAGDSLSLLLSFADYPATAGWALSFALAGPSVVAVTSTASGASHALTLTAAQTGDLAAGLYQWRLRAALSGVIETVAKGTTTLVADLGVSVAGAFASYAEQMLAVVRTARAAILAGEAKMVTINGRMTMFHTLSEVAREEAYWQGRVNAERTGTFGHPVRFDVVGMR